MLAAGGVGMCRVAGMAEARKTWESDAGNNTSVDIGISEANELPFNA